jgi:mRNA interferase MazF
MKGICQGDIYYVDLGKNLGSVQSGVRPCYILQNNTGNRYSPCTIVAAISSKFSRSDIPTHILIPSNNETGLTIDGVIKFEQILTISKKQLRDKIGHYPFEKVLKGFKNSFGLKQISI